MSIVIIIQPLIIRIYLVIYILCIIKQGCQIRLKIPCIDRLTHILRIIDRFIQFIFLYQYRITELTGRRNFMPSRSVLRIRSILGQSGQHFRAFIFFP